MYACSEEVLRGLCCFEPDERWSVGRTIKSRLFDPYRCEAGEMEPTPGELEYMSYLNDDV